MALAVWEKFLEVWPGLQTSLGARRLAEGPEGSPVLGQNSRLSPPQPSEPGRSCLENRTLVQRAGL